MESSKISQQIHAVFGLLMVFFYLGSGIFFLFFASRFNIEKAISGILGVVFSLYGVFRIYMTWKQFKTAFFDKDINR
jgi:hypothetical protein